MFIRKIQKLAETIIRCFRYHIFLPLPRCNIGEIPDTQFTVKGLQEGKPYEFRVAAVNEAGPGKYAETDDAIKPEAPPCLSCCISFC